MPAPPHRTFKGYEEVHVPSAPALPPPTEDELIKISQLEDWAQLAFKARAKENELNDPRNLTGSPPVIC